MPPSRWIRDNLRRSSEALRARLRKSDILRELYGDLDLFRKHGSFRPTKVQIKDSSNYLFACPREPRGRALLRNSCGGQPQVKELWMRAIRALEPDLVLDVGVNYGELLFMPVYAARTRVIGVEPSPDLRPYLEQSLAIHPSRDTMELVFAAAGAEHGVTLSFFVDQAWSGRSSALDKGNLARPVEIQVEQVTIDRLLASSAVEGTEGAEAVAGAAKPTLVFKIDVESYEPEVIAGMHETLRRYDSVGLLEFDGAQLQSLGRTPDAFFASLAERFAIWAMQPGHPLRRAQARSDLANPLAHADLFLVSEPRFADRLGLPA